MILLYRFEENLKGLVRYKINLGRKFLPPMETQDTPTVGGNALRAP
jgi:hypothetical protein